jgi:hypothetical protein
MEAELLTSDINTKGYSLALTHAQFRATMMVIHLQREGAGLTQGGGGHNKVGTDVSTTLISHHITHFDVTLEIDHDRFRHTSLSIRCHLGLGHPLSCSTAQVTILGLTCLRVLVGTARGLMGMGKWGEQSLPFPEALTGMLQQRSEEVFDDSSFVRLDLHGHSHACR